MSSKSRTRSLSADGPLRPRLQGLRAQVRRRHGAVIRDRQEGARSAARRTSARPQAASCRAGGSRTRTAALPARLGLRLRELTHPLPPPYPPPPPPSGNAVAPHTPAAPGAPGPPRPPRTEPNTPPHPPDTPPTPPPPPYPHPPPSDPPCGRLPYPAPAARLLPATPRLERPPFPPSPQPTPLAPAGAASSRRRRRFPTKNRLRGYAVASGAGLPQLTLQRFGPGDGPGCPCRDLTHERLVELVGRLRVLRWLLDDRTRFLDSNCARNLVLRTPHFELLACCAGGAVRPPRSTTTRVRQRHPRTLRRADVAGLRAVVDGAAPGAGPVKLASRTRVESGEVLVGVDPAASTSSGNTSPTSPLSPSTCTRRRCWL